MREDRPHEDQHIPGLAPYLLGQPMTARFATATGLLVGASLTTAAAAVADSGDTVTYMVSSDGPLMSVSYYDEMDNRRQVTDQPANWSTTFTSKATSGLFAVDAQTSGEKVYCRIIINGQVRDQKSASGRNSLRQWAETSLRETATVVSTRQQVAAYFLRHGRGSVSEVWSAGCG